MNFQQQKCRIGSPERSGPKGKRRSFQYVSYQLVCCHEISVELSCKFFCQLSLGEMESKAIASFKYQLVHIELRWVAKQNRRLDASCKKAISVQPCACAITSANFTETNLRQLALGGQTMKNSRQLVHEFELDQSDREPSQVIVSAHK